jgi:hypothetical protein
LTATFVVAIFSGLFATNAPVSFSDRISVHFESDILWRTVYDAKHERGMIFLLMANGLQVYDGGVDFVNPSFVSQLRFDVVYDHLELAGDHGAVYTSDGRIAFVDITDPHDMRLNGHVHVTDTLFDYAMYDSAGFVACGFEGVKIIDQSDLENAAVTDTLGDAVHAVAVEVANGYLYVVDDFNGLLVYDLGDPLEPLLIDFVLFSSPVRDISVTGDRLYLACGESGVHAYSIELPWRIVPRRTYATDSRVLKVESFDEAVLAIDLLGAVHVFGTGSSEARMVLDGHEASNRLDFARRNGRDYLFAPDRSGDFRVLSVDNGSEPDQVWFYPGSYRIVSVALVDSLLLVSGASDNLGIWRIGNGAPEMVSSFESSNQLTYVTALDSLVMVAENSLTTGFIHLLSTADACCTLDMEKTLASVSDVADIKAEYNDTGSVDLVSFGTDGTTIMTIGFPDEPPENFYVAIGFAFIPSGFRVVAVDRAGGYVYTVTSKGSIGKIYDARTIGHSDPVTEIGSFSIHGSVRSVEVLDSVCYIAGMFGLRVFEMDGPLIGTLIDDRYGSYDFQDLVLDEESDLMFAAMGDDGVAIFDISDRMTPELMSIMDTPGFARQLDFADGVIAVADEHSVQMFRYELYDSERDRILPKSFSLSQNYPNPFNNLTRITVSVPASESEGERVLLEIINPLGQVVRTIVDQPLDPGIHVFSWDARESLGEEVASGIYFYRLSVAGFSETRKMLYLK